MKKYLLTDVWVSKELAFELIDSYGCKPDFNMKYSDDVLPCSYVWSITNNAVYKLSNTLTHDEDDLARALLLISNTEAKLEYLNNH